jgi:hypothetical protein
MAKKLTKDERTAWEKDLATLRAAVAQCERVLADDDAANSAEKAAGDHAVVRGIADRDGVGAAILAIREAGGNSIAETVHGGREK